MYKFYIARVSTKQGTQGAEYIQTFRTKEIILKTFAVLSYWHVIAHIDPIS